MNNQHPRFAFGFTITLVVAVAELLVLGPMGALLVAFPLVLQAMFAWKWDRLLSQLMLGSLSLIHLVAVYLDYREFFTDATDAQAGMGVVAVSVLAIPLFVIGWFGIGIYNAKANHQPIRIFH